MFARRSQAIDFAILSANEKSVWASTQGACRKDLISLMVHRR
jgi:hypothetical protein